MSPNPKDLLAQVQRLQTEIAKAREELAEQTVESASAAVRSAGDDRHPGMPQGDLDPGVVKPEELDLLQDLMSRHQPGDPRFAGACRPPSWPTDRGLGGL